VPGCSAPCRCETFAEHVRSLSVAHPDRRGWKKTVTDVHDKHTVDVTQHWHDRQDVTVKLQEPVRMRGDRKTGRLENVDG
jgi:hypothetical protein